MHCIFCELLKRLRARGLYAEAAQAETIKRTDAQRALDYVLAMLLRHNREDR